MEIYEEILILISMGVGDIEIISIGTQTEKYCLDMKHSDLILFYLIFILFYLILSSIIYTLRALRQIKTNPISKTVLR